MPRIVWTIAVVGLWFSTGTLKESMGASAAPVSANPFVIQTWDTDKGLPHNTVTSIVQTRDGYLWLGTLSGLVRFDGNQFAVFDESNTPGLNSSRIVKLFEDRDGILWIGTETAGILCIKEGEVTSLGIGQGPFEKRLASVCQDAAGALWLYSANGELWRYWTNRLTPFLFGFNRPSSCRVIIAESSGPVRIGTDWSLGAIRSSPALGSPELPVQADATVRKLDFLLASRQGGYWRMADNQVQKWNQDRLEHNWGPYPWERERITCAAEDLQGHLIVGTLGRGVFWFGPEGHASSISSAEGLSYNNVLSLCLDREGSLWVGTDGGGLDRIKRRVFEVLDVSQDSLGRAVQSVCEDDQKGIWLGSIGGGAAYWREGKLQRFGVSQGLPSANVWSVLVDRHQRVWAGTWDRGLFLLQDGQFQRMPGLGVIPRGIHAIYQDRKGHLWVGTQGGLARWDDKEWQLLLTTSEVQAIADDSEGNLWIGTVGGGLSRLQNGQITSYHRQPGQLPSEDIASLCVDADDVLWIGTPGGGLVRFFQGKWTRYTTREGLASNGIGYLVEDTQGYLWMGSNKGLMRVRKQELNDFSAGLTNYINCRTYGQPEGLPTRECTQGSQPGAIRSRNGRLWFSTAKGLVSIHPDQLQPNLHPPPVMIESVWVDGQPLITNALRPQIPLSIVIPAGKERLEIRYTSLNLAAPERGRYQYRMKGHETAWIEAGGNRSAGYSKLPPGHYDFEVKACNEDGIWNELGCSLAIIVNPPFWRRAWFLSLVGVCLLGTIVGTVHHLSTQKLQRQVALLKQQEALEHERSRIAQDIHDQLGANLTQVSLLGELVENDKHLPEEVESHARQITQTARETTRILDEIVWAVNPANDTLDSLVSYLCKYAQEYLTVAGLRYRLEVPDSLPAIVIPPDFRHNIYLAFKESVTNIVRHAKATSAWVRLRLEPSLFILEIQDDGRGVADLDEKKARTRNGLRGMRKRLEDIGGSFSIGPGPTGGTLVRLTVPLSQQTEKT